MMSGLVADPACRDEQSLKTEDTEFFQTKVFFCGSYWLDFASK